MLHQIIASIMVFAKEPLWAKMVAYSSTLSWNGLDGPTQYQTS